MDPFLVLQHLMQACSQNNADVQNLCSELGLKPPQFSTETGADGASIRVVRTAFSDPHDLSLPIGTWKLRLIPTPSGASGQVEVPITLHCNVDDGTFRDLRVELLRFELEADPNDLIAADLHVDPHTYLTPTQTTSGARVPVRLLGPGLTLILRGTAIDDLDFEFHGAEGSSDPDFPSARFEPPHFILCRGGIPSDIGIVCDEVLVDLKRDDDPAIVQETLPELAGSFRGFYLKELGVFIGDGAEAGTWSGMAAMHNFFVELNPGKFTGTFVAELVHLVVDEPQVQVSIYFQNQDGVEILAADDGDATVGAPTGDRDYVRVRLEAKPSWDSAGFRPQWIVPPDVQVEEPNRLTQLNLGWVHVPPGDHAFTVAVKDHRIVPDVVETRRVIVAEPALPDDDPDKPPFSVVLDGILEDAGFPEGQRPTNRLHMTMRPGQKATITARAYGTPDGLSATLQETPDGFFSIVSSAPSGDPPNLIQGLEHLPNSNQYELAQWVVRAPTVEELEGFDEPHAVLFVDVKGAVEESGTPVVKTLTRRLRITVEPDPPENRPDLQLDSFTDWRADVGIGLASVELRNGLAFETIAWSLEQIPVDTTLLSDPGHDKLFFEDLPFPVGESVALSNSAGAVRPYLHEKNRLWRLTGRVPKDAAAALPRLPIIIGEPDDSHALSERPVAAFLAGEPLSDQELAGCGLAPQGGAGLSHPKPEPYIRLDGSAVPAIRFQYDCAEIQPEELEPVPQPPPRCYQRGPEHESLFLGLHGTNLEQARGIAALLRAIGEYGDQIDEIGLFGAASVEGPPGYNCALSEARVNAVYEALTARPLPSRLVAAMNSDELAEADRYTVEQEVLDRIDALDAAGKITRRFFGERTAREVVVDAATGERSPVPADRRVFAILLLKPATADEDVVRREFFVTLPGAPTPPETRIMRRPKLQDHPFRHAMFRFARVEVELRRNELIRALVLVKLDLEKFNENDVLSDGGLNELDGLTDLVFEFRQDPNPPAGAPRYSWELAALADPQDKDGFTLHEKPSLVAGTVGPSAVVLPPLTALSGGRTGLSGFVLSISIGTLLSSLGVLDVQTFIWRGIRARILHGNATSPAFRVALDYTVRYHIDFDLGAIVPGLPALKTDPDNPIEISFRNVGVEFRRGSVNVEFFYDPDSGFQLEVDDPGVFRLGDGIGRLLNVESFRTGAGSPLFFEVELSLALETGIFSVDTLRIRASLEIEKLFAAQDGTVTLGGDSISVEDLSLSLNKLGVTVDVPGTLAGRGELGLSGNSVTGEVDIGLVPLDLRIYGAIAVQSEDDFHALFAALGVDLAPGILLGTTGAALYGFHGLIGVNMARSQPEPLPWYKRPPLGVSDPDAKWQVARGGWAFGVGTVVGTAYDDGFSFNTKGAFILELPGPKFLLATESRFLQNRPQVKDEQTGSLVSVVMLDLENDLLLIGIDFTYREPNLLEFRVPTEVFFNLADSDDWHVRFGQWEPVSKRIALRLLNYFDAWGYFVLEGDGSQINAPLDLSGVSLATGARIELLWGAKSIGLYLEAFVEYHAGLQLKPIYLEGVLEVGGELHLVVASIGASGKLAVKAPDPFVIRGEVCGELGFWRFKTRKCIPFTVGEGDAKTPTPDNPYNKTVVIDRMTSAAVPDANRSPIDAVLHLIFDMDMIDARPEAERAINLSDLGLPRNQVSTDLHYEFRLQDVRLVREPGDLPVDLIQSAWGPYSLPLPADASADAGAKADAMRTLRLLDWVPNSHSRALDFRRGYGETVRRQVKRLCDPTPEPEPGCATFDQAPLGIQSFWLLDQEPLAPVVVLSSQGDGLGAEMLGDLAGATWARVVPLVPVSYPGRIAEAHSLRLPGSGRRVDRPSLQEVVSRLPEVIETGTGFEAERTWLAGLLLIRLPDLVAVDATFVVPAELPQGGELVFLDALLKPLSPITTLQDLPFVPGSSGSGAFGSHLARRLTLGPPAQGEIDPPRVAWLVVNPPGLPQVPDFDPYSYLNEICGIPYQVWRQGQERDANKQRTRDGLAQVAGVLSGTSTDPDQGLLDPDTRYRLQGTIAWVRYRSATGLDEDGSGTFPLDAAFRTDADPPQDIRRYILHHDPPGTGQPHYYEEEVKITFASDVIDRLFAKFGDQLVARAHSDVGGHVLNQPLLEAPEGEAPSGFGREFFPSGTYERALHDALGGLEDDCRPAGFGNLFPKPTLTFTKPLMPNTGYTVTLIPRPLGEHVGLDAQEWNRRLQKDFDDRKFVFRFDMRTSRWATFGDHLAAYDTAAAGDVLAADEAALDVVLAAITRDRGDEAIDALSQALFGGPLGIPEAPEIVRVWVPTGPPPDAFSPPPLRCRAILLDGPEPLLKRRPDGSERVTIDARQSQRADDDLATSGPLDGLRVIAGAQGARLFLCFDAAAPPPFVQIALRDRPGGNGADTTAHLVIPVGDTPGSFDEEGK